MGGGGTGFIPPKYSGTSETNTTKGGGEGDSFLSLSLQGDSKGGTWASALVVPSLPMTNDLMLLHT